MLERACLFQTLKPNKGAIPCQKATKAGFRAPRANASRLFATLNGLFGLLQTSGMAHPFMHCLAGDFVLNMGLG
jgi:hypothetical protein